MDEAFIENSEHDIDGRQRGEDQDRLVAERLLIGLRRARESGLYRARQADPGGGVEYGLHGVAQSNARLQVEGESHRRTEALMVDRQRCGGRAETGESVQGNLLSARRPHIDLA